MCDKYYSKSDLLRQTHVRNTDESFAKTAEMWQEGKNIALLVVYLYQRILSGNKVDYMYRKAKIVL